MTNKVGHLFICLLTSFVNCLFKPSIQLFIKLSILKKKIVYLFLIDLYKLVIYFGYESYTNLFFHSVACLSNLLVV